MLDKIRFKKLWFVLLVLPLILTPVSSEETYLSYGASRTIYEGTALGGPFLTLPRVWIWDADWEDAEDVRNSLLFIDWGRIAYWEAWMLTICFGMNRKRLFNKGG